MRNLQNFLLSSMIVLCLGMGCNSRDWTKPASTDVVKPVTPASASSEYTVGQAAAKQLLLGYATVYENVSISVKGGETDWNKLNSGLAKDAVSNREAALTPVLNQLMKSVPPDGTITKDSAKPFDDVAQAFKDAAAKLGEKPNSGGSK
jgi:hypothetical protein